MTKSHARYLARQRRARIMDNAALAGSIAVALAIITAPAWFLYAARLACEGMAYVLGVTL